VRFLSLTPILISLICIFSVLQLTQAQAAEQTIPDSIKFNRDIRPILSDNCFFCHGPDKNTREANLRLDTPEGLVSDEEHAAALVPGKPDDSELIRRILSTDPSELMPPPQSGKSLTDRDRELLKRWIEQGGQYEGHWAFLPIQTPSPTIAGDSVSNVIDGYIKKSLEPNGLAPSPEADRVTLIRRLSFDLIGLPPTIEEVDDFISDASPSAFEKRLILVNDSRSGGSTWYDLLTPLATTVINR
jgi:hypothetical protein